MLLARELEGRKRLGVLNSDTVRGTAPHDQSSELVVLQRRICVRDGVAEVRWGVLNVQTDVKVWRELQRGAASLEGAGKRPKAKDASEVRKCGETILMAET